MSKLSSIPPKGPSQQSPAMPDYSSREVRQIDNGYIVREHSSNEQGHTTSEHYHQSHPGNISVREADHAGSMLRDAIACIDRPYAKK